MPEPTTSDIRIHPPVWALLIAVLLGGGFYVWGKTVETRDHTPTTISVSGEGKMSAAPDIAELDFGVQAEKQPTAKQAMQMLSKQMTAVLEAVKKAGVEEKDIATEQLSLNPAYDWQNGTQTLRGYAASQTLRVKVRDLDKTSDVLGAATAAGANQAGGVQFTMDDPEASRAQARAKAIAQSQEKAKTLAAQLGMTLGKVKSFSESGGASPPMLLRAMEMKSAAVAPSAPPIPAGEQETTVNVNLTYELE